MRKEFLTRLLVYVANFAFAIGVLIVSCAWSGIYPFGDRSFLTEDLMFQYVDFFTWFQNVLLGEGSLFYSTSQALGNNTWGLYSYYLGSPLNFLIVFFEQGAITEFVFFVTALKIGFVQVATVFFIRKRFGLSYFLCSVLALGFTWSSWTATQLRNPEWLDVLIFLPLAAWGVYELIRSKRWGLLIASVALAVICCWYTAYMLILFLFLYFVFELWMFRNGVDIGCDTLSSDGRAPAVSSKRPVGVLRNLVTFVAVILGALLLSAFTFLPTVLAMSGGTSPSLVVDAPGRGLVTRALDLAASHPMVMVALLAFVAIVIALVLFVMRSKKIGHAARLWILVAVIVVCSLGIGLGLFARHLSTCGIVAFAKGFICGGWVVNDVPQLYAGTLILVLAVAFFFVRRIPFNLKVACLALLAVMLLSVFCMLLYMIWCGFRAPNGFYCRITFLALFVMLWMAASFVSYERNRARSHSNCTRRIVCVILAVAVVCDVMISVHSEWEYLYQGYPQSAHEEYVANSKAEISDLRESDGSTYRIAKNYSRSALFALNEGMAMGYDELSSYSSVHDNNAIALLNDLGYSMRGEFSTRYAYPILASDALLGVKYAYSTIPPEGLEAIWTEPNLKGALLYENPYALSLGYVADDDIEELSFAGTSNPFQRQNVFVNSLLGYELNPYVSCEVTEVSSSPTGREYEAVIPAGCVGYAYVVDGGDKICSIEMDNRAPFTENYCFQDSIYGIAGVSGESQTVKMRLTAIGEGIVITPDALLDEDTRIIVWALDMSRFEEAMSTLGKFQASIDVFDGNRIEGNIDYAPDGEADERIMMISVPAAPGWNACVNGEKVDIVSLAGGALTGIPISSGANHFELTFFPPGLALGTAVSLISFVVLIVICIVTRRKKMRQLL